MKARTISITPETLFMLEFQEIKNHIDSDYIPGACNIGREEIKRRKMATIFSAILTIAVMVLILTLDANKIWRLLLFIPATSLGVSFQQWYFKFCVAFGIKGVFNFGDIGKTFSIEQKENYRKDRIKAWQMIISGVVFGVVVAQIFYYLPN